MQKKLLILNASDHEIPFILAARKLGYYVITTSTKSEYLGHKYADEYVYGNYNDYDEMIRLMKDRKIDAVSHACTDDCALSAAYIGEQLGLKGHDTYENACIIHRKDKFKDFCKKYNVISPRSDSFYSLEEAYSFAGECKYPVIVKPSDLAGGIGISVAYDKEQYITSVELAFEKSHSKHIVVEQYIEGTLHSLSTFIVDQKIMSYATEDDKHSYNAYMTNWGIWNALDWEKVKDILLPEVERIAQILGLVDGYFHLQYMIDKDGNPWIIEMMRRNIGNNNFIAMTNGYGLDWAEWVIRAEAGEDCHLIPKKCIPEGHWGYFMVMSPQNGVFDKIVIEPEFKKYVYQIYEWQDSGYEITNYLMEKVGSVMFVFPTLEERLKYEDKVNDMIHVMLK